VDDRNGRRLTNAEIADLLDRGPPVTCEPWIKPLSSYLRHVRGDGSVVEEEEQAPSVRMGGGPRHGNLRLG
jgi:hypothetical protein